MSIQGTGARKQSRVGAALVALALAVAVVVLATQASSIWSTKAGSQVRAVPAHVVAPGANLGPWSSSHLTNGCRGCRPKFGREHSLRRSSHLPNGCRPKFGCEHSLRRSSHFPNGCRVKYGCGDGGSTTTERS